MASSDINAKLKISLEMAQDAEEFIRKLVREEIEKCLMEKTQMLRARAPYLSYESKGELEGEGWQR